MLSVDVPLPETTHHGDKLNVYGEWGETITNPDKLRAHAARAYAGRRAARPAAVRGWGFGTFGEGTFGGVPAGAGWGESIWLDGVWDDPRPVRRVALDDVVGFGRFAVTVRPVDPEGNEATATAVQTVTVVEPPRGVHAVSVSGYDPVTDVVTFNLKHLTAGTP